MATRKSPSGTGKTGSGTTRRSTTAKSAGKTSTSTAKKSDPVVLDPPKTSAAKPEKQPETIDAKAEDVTPPKPQSPKAEPAAAKADTKADTAKPEEPATPSKDGKPAQSPKPAPAAPPVSAGNRGATGFAALVAGGVVAAAIGYFANDMLNPPPELPDYGAEIARMDAALTDKVTAQAATIAGLSDQIAALDERITALETARANSPVARAEEEIASLKAELEAEAADLAARIQDTEARLAEVLADLDASRSRIAETLSTAGGEVNAEIAALLQKYDAEISALKEQLAQQARLGDETRARLDDVAATANEKLDAARAKMSELTEQATEAARDIDLTLARERLKAAVESGKAYAAILGEIADEAATDIPEALLNSANEGVATLPELRAAFPEVARAALKASIRAEADEGTGNKLWAFLKSQVGARSLEEREGEDPDAVLSQAEAALDRGDLAEAARLVKTLPAAGIVEMSGWLARAEARLAVERALAEFGTRTE